MMTEGGRRRRSASDARLPAVTAPAARDRELNSTARTDWSDQLAEYRSDREAAPEAAPRRRISPDDEARPGELAAYTAWRA